MDNLWDATRGSTLGKSAADQAKRYVLLTRIGQGACGVGLAEVAA